MGWCLYLGVAYKWRLFKGGVYDLGLRMTFVSANPDLGHSGGQHRDPQIQKKIPPSHRSDRR